MTDDTTPQTDPFVICETLLREHDRDAWLAALFSPPGRRKYCHALYAFAHEINRISSIVSEPALGEIRLQWWSEALSGERAGEALANPVAAALLQTMADCKLPKNALSGLIEARRFDLYNDPMPSLHDLQGYCGETVSAVLRMASIALCEGSEPGGAEACGHAGVALGMTQMLLHLPKYAARGQCYVPKDVLTRHGALPQAVAAGVTSQPLLNALSELRAVARDHARLAGDGLAQMDKVARPALVQLSLVEPLLKRMERRGYDPFSSDTSLPQWRSQWAMWRWNSR